VIPIRVSYLLNGVDVGGVRSRFCRTEGRDRLVRLFIGYASQDEALKNELEVHLKVLEQTGQVSIWNDRLVAPGDERVTEIDRNLEDADIVLLLVSAEFLASEYVSAHNIRLATDRVRRGDTDVIPVIVRACHWRRTKLGRFMPLPRDGKPVASRRSRDDAWTEIVAGVEKVIERQISGRGY
jgi:internalin A